MADRPLSQEYAPAKAPGSGGGLISQVDEGSPAWEAGLRPGMRLVAAEGQGLRDVIDWEWIADGPEVEVEGMAPVELLGASAADFGDLGDAREVEFSCTLSRAPGQSWGISFADPLFGPLITCVNHCTFCFMRMLPHDLRPALYVRDDDYRLSFLQGNFVTLTNLADADVERIIECGLEPLHVSLHAVSHCPREALIGGNEARGLEVVDQLLGAGLKLHVQIVLVPQVNDGAELDRTLGWVEARPGVLTCGIVPLGFTRFQDRFTAGFNDPAAAQAVIDQVRPYQERARRQLGRTRFHLSDEFYLNARRPLPPASYYDGFPQYEDGIGMLRSFADAWQEASGRIARVAERIAVRPSAPLIASGEAFIGFLTPLVAASPLAQAVELRAVKNRFFGGNVDVAGLLTAQDLVDGLAGVACGRDLLLPDVILNASGLTLDDKTPDELEAALDCRLHMVSSTVEGLIGGLERL